MQTYISFSFFFCQRIKASRKKAHDLVLLLEALVCSYCLLKAETFTWIFLIISHFPIMFILIFPEDRSHDGAIKQLEFVVSGRMGLDVQRAVALCPSLVTLCRLPPQSTGDSISSTWRLRELKSAASTTVVKSMLGQLKETNTYDTCFQSHTLA